jgi:thiol-disulfide isomerase/thioredoxin
LALLLAAAVLAGELDAAALVKAVRAQHGRPVVVSFWATWCEPCVREFPELVALARARKDTVFVSVSIDEPKDRSKVQALVTKQAPPFPVFMKSRGPDQAFIDAVDREWSGVVPATLVYDREGRRSALLQGEHTPAQIEKALGPAAP